MHRQGRLPKSSAAQRHYFTLRHSKPLMYGDLIIGFTAVEATHQDLTIALSGMMSSFEIVKIGAGGSPNIQGCIMRHKSVMKKNYEQIFGAAKLNLKIIDLPIHYCERTYDSTNRLR